MSSLNKGQKEGFKKACDWWENKDKQVFTIQGGPGTGKTFIINKLIEKFGINKNNVLFVTFVGRATLPLRQNGLNAKTIHSTCYMREEDYVLDSNGNPIILGNNRYKKSSKFILKPTLPSNIELIVADEAGMIDNKMCNDLESFGIPIIATGDRDQLPPVFGKSKWIHQQPDVLLTEVMRQKKGDPIIHIAKMINNGEYIEYGKYGERCFVVDEEILKYPEIYLRPDIVICGKNKTREKINNIVRYDVLKRPSELPLEGDRLVCRKNNWGITIPDNNDIALINGLFGTITHVYDETFNGKTVEINFKPECSDTEFESIELDLDYLVAPHEIKKNKKWFNGNQFDYGFASTCHMAQGSQYGYVLVIDEQIGDESYHKKFLYTAVTRAKHTLVVVRKRKKKSFFMNL